MKIFIVLCESPLKILKIVLTPVGPFVFASNGPLGSHMDSLLHMVYFQANEVFDEFVHQGTNVRLEREKILRNGKRQCSWFFKDFQIKQ